MPRYYFHVYDSQEKRDVDGVDFPDSATAKIAAQRFAGEYIRDAKVLFDFGGALRIDVEDEAATRLFCAHFNIAELPKPN